MDSLADKLAQIDIDTEKKNKYEKQLKECYDINNVLILEKYSHSILYKANLQKYILNWLKKGNEKWPAYKKNDSNKKINYPISENLEKNTHNLLLRLLHDNIAEIEYVGNQRSDITLIIKIPNEIKKQLRGNNVSDYFIFHIDIKTVLNGDCDSTFEKIHIGINQTSILLNNSIKKYKTDNRFYIKGNIPVKEDNMYSITSIIKYPWKYYDSKYIVDYIGIYIIPNGMYFHLINQQIKDNDYLLKDMTRPKSYKIEDGKTYAEEIRINICHLCKDFYTKINL